MVDPDTGYDYDDTPDGEDELLLEDMEFFMSTGRYNTAVKVYEEMVARWQENPRFSDSVMQIANAWMDEIERKVGQR